jgi:signal transduction histidine kinase
MTEKPRLVLTGLSVLAPTGLSLSAVHGIVIEHGDTIKIESHPGQGTIVNVELPLTMNER